MAKTVHFGFDRFASEGRISDNGYKFSDKDRQLIDAILYSLANHDHQAVANGQLEGVATSIRPDLLLSSTGGIFPSGRDYHYKISYVDIDGGETAASAAGIVSTSPAIQSPTAQILTTASTGGTLVAGTYKYALSFYQTAGGETTAPVIMSIVVPSGTSTNIVTIPLDTLPDGANGWKIYRKGPGDLEYFFLASVASGASTYVDDGTVAPDCTKKRPNSNSTNSTSKVTVSIPASELPLDTRIVGWRIYRTQVGGSYGPNSLLETVVETTTENGADLVTSFVDVGNALVSGIPLGQTAIPPPVPQLDAGGIFGADSGRLPPALAPLGVRAFNVLLPGTLVDAKTYHKVTPPFDMEIERLDGFYLTAPTGLTGANYLTVRLEDASLVNEVQSISNNAVTRNEIQKVSNTATGGTFTLSDGTDTTSAIAYNATAATIETRLETDITAIVDVQVTGDGTVAFPWVVEFADPGDQNVGFILIANDTGLTGGTSTVTTTIEGSNGGTFTLSDGTDTTSAIAYNAAAATIETRLETDITAITAVTVTGTGTSIDPWVVEFVTPGATNVDMLIASDTSLNGVTTILETVRGSGNSNVDLVIDANSAEHSWQSSTTDEGTFEAEDAPATGGTQVSDTLALNDVAMELDAQFETNEVTIGTLEAGDYNFKFYVADTDQASTFDARVMVNDGVAAEGSLTLDTNPSNNDTVTVDTKTYTFQTTLTNVDGNILIGASTAASQANLVAAFDLSGVAGTDYATLMTAHPTVDIAAFAANVAVLTAKATGTAGNSIATTETFTAGTNVFDAATLGTTTTGVNDTEHASLTVGTNRSVYTPAYELGPVTLDGTESIRLEVEKTDATANRVRVDRYEYAVDLPTLHAGVPFTVEVIKTGTPTTLGDDLQLTVWY